MYQTNLLRQLLASFLFCILFACTKPNEEKPNRPPGDFTVSVSGVTFNSATLTWTAATDPENEAVSYTIELNGQAVASNVTATTQALSSLQKNTAYTGKVTAKDASGNSTAANFSFNTSDSPPPSDFTVKLDASTNKSLTVSWTAATIPTGESILYDVYAGTTLKAANISQLQHTLTGLAPKTAYQVKVVAKTAGGKSTEKILSAQTADNASPSALTAQADGHGFSFLKLKWTAATDADGDSISYFLSRNGSLTPLTEAAVNGTYTHVVKGLTPSTVYSVGIVAKDAYGGEVASNTVQVTTNQGPEDNFIFSINNVAEVEWIQPYTGQFNPSASTYSINGVEKSLATVQVNFLNLGNGKLYVKIFLNTTDFPFGETKQVKFKLNWAANESITQSKTNTYTRYFYSATLAQVATAVIKKHSNGDHGFVLTFKNDMASEYTTWTVQEVKFDHSIQGGSISLQSASGKTVQSVSGSLTEADYNYLKTKTDGYILIKDEGGNHRINFSYTVQ